MTQKASNTSSQKKFGFGPAESARVKKDDKGLQSSKITNTANDDSKIKRTIGAGHAFKR